MNKAEFFRISFNKKDSYMPGLDVYRAFAILFGLFWHFLQIDSENNTLINILSTGPWGGANPLFVVSGFLLGGQIFSRIVNDKSLSMKNFFLRRILKTWPAYFAMIIFILVLGCFYSFNNIPTTFQLLTFTQNFDLKNSFLSHTWSLCIEEHFYLVLTLTSYFFFSKPSLKKVTFVFILLFVCELFVRYFLWQKYLSMGDAENFNIYFNRIYYQTYCRIDGLIAGLYLAYFANMAPVAWKKIIDSGKEILPFGVLLCLLGFVLQINRTSLISTLLVYPLETIGLSMIMIYCLNASAFVNKMNSRWISITATLSYCLYLTHKPIFHLIDTVIHSLVSGFPLYLSLTFVLSIFFTFLSAYFLYILIEKPFLLFRERFKI
jgi:peptidoglycan/LPS O-acetylase OafA/YrhL